MKGIIEYHSKLFGYIQTNSIQMYMKILRQMEKKQVQDVNKERYISSLKQQINLMKEETVMRDKKIKKHTQCQVIDEVQDPLMKEIANDKNRKKQINHAKFDQMYQWHCNEQYLKRNGTSKYD